MHNVFILILDGVKFILWLCKIDIVTFSVVLIFISFILIALGDVMFYSLSEGRKC
jgi:hypothetical protein